MSSASSDVSTDSNDDLNPPRHRRVLAPLSMSARAPPLPPSPPVWSPTPSPSPPLSPPPSSSITIFARNPARDGPHIDRLLATPYLIVSTSARNRHCGADALRHLLATSPTPLHFSTSTIADRIQSLLPPNFARDFRVYDRRDVTPGHEDLLEAQYRANFADNQLAGGLRELGGGRYVLGVVEKSRDTDSSGTAFVQWSASQGDTAVPAAQEEARPVDVEEALWVWNTGGHWEALVPQERATPAMREECRVLRFERPILSPISDVDAYEDGSDRKWVDEDEVEFKLSLQDKSDDGLALPLEGNKGFVL